MSSSTVPTDVCQESAVRRAGKICQMVSGKIADRAVAALMIEMATPMALAGTPEDQRELETRALVTDTTRRQHVERLRYDAELALQRYVMVASDNGLVADAPEASGRTSCAIMPKLRGYERREAAGASRLRWSAVTLSSGKNRLHSEGDKNAGD